MNEEGIRVRRDDGLQIILNLAEAPSSFGWEHLGVLETDETLGGINENAIIQDPCLREKNGARHDEDSPFQMIYEFYFIKAFLHESAYSTIASR